MSANTSFINDEYIDLDLLDHDEILESIN